MTTQLNTDTELSAVNSILGSIGQSPITAINLTNLQNPEIALVHNILMEVTKDVQNEGWHFNQEEHLPRKPNDNGHFLIPNNYLRFDVHDGLYDRTRDVVKRDGKLYDKVEHTDVFSSELYFDITYLFDFEDIPSAIQRYIIARSSVRAATQIVSNSD